jgi:hypothetical protein
MHHPEVRTLATPPAWEGEDADVCEILIAFIPVETGKKCGR